MIEATRRKLGEARFFYGHLVKERQQTTRHDPAAFRYYFSAFIQAARNVLWVLHHEEKEKWEAWKPGWESTLTQEEQKLLKFTNELRLDEVKRGGANALAEWEVVALNELLRSVDVEPWRQHPAYGHHMFAPPGTPPPQVRRRAYYFEQEDGKQEVTALCQRYLEFLEKTLKDFCADHPPA